jgi:hypothetical protein
MGAEGGSTPFPGSMAPKDVALAYKVPSSTSAGGKIVALIELPSVHAMADVNAYRLEFGIPALPACPVDGSGVPKPAGTACFARVGEDGTVNSVSTSDCPGWSGETGLDMDMVSAACPDCSIVLVEATTTTDLDRMNTVAATVVGAAAASNSWGGVESGLDDPSPYASPGILTLAASGDSGYDNEGQSLGGPAGPNFPATAPSVVGVGGTTLTESGGQYSEVVWNDATAQRGLFGGTAAAGGSGCSQEFPRPSWQMLPGFSFGSCTMRASVDLSAAAQFNPSGLGGGIAAYDADDNGWNSVEGTSAATPLVAALLVRLGLAGKDNHELFYKNSTDFNDITSGTNDNDHLCSDVMCTAGKGWDGPTGLGSPNGELLTELVEPTSDAGAKSSADASVKASINGGATASDDASSANGSGFGSDAAAQAAALAESEGGAIGAACSDSADCANQAKCVSPGAGQSSVCASACDSTGSCPNGDVCQNAFCFAASGAPNFSNEMFPSGGRRGCSLSAMPASPSSGAGGMAAGLFAIAALQRRRMVRGGRCRFGSRPR